MEAALRFDRLTPELRDELADAVREGCAAISARLGSSGGPV